MQYRSPSTSPETWLLEAGEAHSLLQAGTARPAGAAAEAEAHRDTGKPAVLPGGGSLAAPIGVASVQTLVVVQQQDSRPAGCYKQPGGAGEADAHVSNASGVGPAAWEHTEARIPLAPTSRHNADTAAELGLGHGARLAVQLFTSPDGAHGLHKGQATPQEVAGQGAASQRSAEAAGQQQQPWEGLAPAAAAAAATASGMAESGSNSSLSGPPSLEVSGHSAGWSRPSVSSPGFETSMEARTSRAGSMAAEDATPNFHTHAGGMASSGGSAATAAVTPQLWRTNTLAVAGGLRAGLGPEHARAGASSNIHAATSITLNFRAGRPVVSGQQGPAAEPAALPQAGGHGRHLKGMAEDLESVGSPPNTNTPMRTLSQVPVAVLQVPELCCRTVKRPLPAASHSTCLKDAIANRVLRAECCMLRRFARVWAGATGNGADCMLPGQNTCSLRPARHLHLHSHPTRSFPGTQTWAPCRLWWSSTSRCLNPKRHSKGSMEGQQRWRQVVWACSSRHRLWRLHSGAAKLWCNTTCWLQRKAWRRCWPGCEDQGRWESSGWSSSGCVQAWAACPCWHTLGFSAATLWMSFWLLGEVQE